MVRLPPTKSPASHNWNDRPFTRMKNPFRGRKRGGVPRTIDYIQSCLLKKQRAAFPEKGAALLQVAEFIRVIADQALQGDADCGYFLGELSGTLHKSQETLANANETFRQRHAEIRSAHFATAKDSPLRARIERIIREAQREKRRQHILHHIPEVSIVLKPNKRLLMVPELTVSDEAVNAWTDVIVYPRLRQNQKELRALFDSGKLQKARDKNGKFQISRLKSLIRQTVARIAKLPRVYYFGVGS